jgi:hypothetical protein
MTESLRFEEPTAPKNRQSSGRFVAVHAHLGIDVVTDSAPVEGSHPPVTEKRSGATVIEQDEPACAPEPDRLTALLPALLVLIVTCEDRSPVELGLN